MSTFILMMKLTDQGAKAIKDAPARIESGIKGLTAMGGKVLGFYATLGEFDYIALAEVPNDEVMVTFALALGSLGNVHTQTIKAFTVEQFTAIVKTLP